jgi:hypothetical protein
MRQRGESSEREEGASAEEGGAAAARGTGLTVWFMANLVTPHFPCPLPRSWTLYTGFHGTSAAMEGAGAEAAAGAGTPAVAAAAAVKSVAGMEAAWVVTTARSSKRMSHTNSWPSAATVMIWYDLPSYCSSKRPRADNCRDGGVGGGGGQIKMQRGWNIGQDSESMHIQA